LARHGFSDLRDCRVSRGPLACAAGRGCWLGRCLPPPAEAGLSAMCCMWRLRVGAETTSAAVTWPSDCLGRPAVPPPAPRCVSFSGAPWRSLATWTRPVATRQTETDVLS